MLFQVIIYIFTFLEFVSLIGGDNELKKQQLVLMKEIKSEFGDLKSKFGKLEHLIKSSSEKCTPVSVPKPHKKDVYGAIYIRWGRKDCTKNGTELVYTGYTAGSWYLHTGAAANFLCLPRIPEWGVYQDSHEGKAYVYGTEYETGRYSIGKEALDKKLQNQDAPCAVCQSRLRSSVIMIPAKRSCINGWHLEYSGYLMAGYHSNKNGATEYICVDGKPDVIHGGKADKNGRLLYPVEVQCGSLRCPPYVANRELTCVVCSR